jgi:hypothetical protein
MSGDGFDIDLQLEEDLQDPKSGLGPRGGTGVGRECLGDAIDGHDEERAARDEEEAGTSGVEAEVEVGRNECDKANSNQDCLSVLYSHC